MLRSSPSAQDADQRRSSERLRVGLISLKLRMPPLFCQRYVDEGLRKNEENRAIAILHAMTGQDLRLRCSMCGNQPCGKRMR